MFQEETQNPLTTGTPEPPVETPTPEEPQAPEVSQAPSTPETPPVQEAPQPEVEVSATQQTGSKKWLIIAGVVVIAAIVIYIVLR